MDPPECAHHLPLQALGALAPLFGGLCGDRFVERRPRYSVRKRGLGPSIIDLGLRPLRFQIVQDAG